MRFPVITERSSRPRGIVLPTVLILLLILSVAAVALTGQIGTQTRMAGNSANTAASVQTAEAVLRYATTQLVSDAANYTEAKFRSNANGLYYFDATHYNSSTPLPWQTPGGWAAAPEVPGSVFGDAAKERRFMIEELPAVITPGASKQKAYRITARVIGVGGQGVVILQTLYKI